MLLWPPFTHRKTDDGDGEHWLDSARSERRKGTFVKHRPNLESISGIATVFLYVFKWLMLCPLSWGRLVTHLYPLQVEDVNQGAHHGDRIDRILACLVSSTPHIPQSKHCHPLSYTE